MLPIFGFIFVIGIALLLLAFCKVLWDDGMPFVSIVGTILVLTAATFFVVLIYDESYVPHPSFSLREDEWACTSAHTVPITTTTMVGKVPVTTTTMSKVCDSYGRIVR